MLKELFRITTGRLRYVWHVLIGLIFGIVCLASITWAATYNFYFNNTEQGNNSTATPTVTVTDGKAQKSDGTDKKQAETATTPAQPAATAPASDSAASSNTSSASLKSIAEEEIHGRQFRRVRLTAGPAVIWNKATISNSYYDGYSWSNYDNSTFLGRWGGMINLGVYLSKRCGHQCIRRRL
jgi:uncharacterized iron-regulated membrane protein